MLITGHRSFEHVSDSPSSTVKSNIQGSLRLSAWSSPKRARGHYMAVSAHISCVSYPTQPSCSSSMNQCCVGHDLHQALTAPLLMLCFNLVMLSYRIVSHWTLIDHYSTHIVSPYNPPTHAHNSFPHSHLTKKYRCTCNHRPNEHAIDDPYLLSQYPKRSENFNRLVFVS